MFDLEMLEARKPSDRTGQHCYVILFCSPYVIHNDCNAEFTWISKLNGLFILCQIIIILYYDNLTKIYFSARWLHGES